ncbi:hypothetical protein H2198_004991 [Neophaeococcomyces mojaviensis]|uniref:Uncharacterized protein n=1 Tax=Neophaeococcomyces mojaviensis TaxID=3383035 RepID=A0ACC3A7E0_9EURO|nr:hypothetical protein H2198_004991 [Knufia sp. JES_112]
MTRSLFALKPDPSSIAALGAHGLESVIADPNRVNRQMYDCRTTQSLPGLLVRHEGQDRTRDRAVDNAYDGFGITFKFFSEIFGRNSIDGNSMVLVASIHYDHDYNNASWISARQQMVFGDGDGIQFDYLTDSLDVIAHELTHGVTEHTCKFIYETQSGALNESISDVFACMVEQWHINKQTADQADWLLGQNVLPLNRKGQALRSLKNPGTAYDDSDSTEIKRKDRQVGHMNQYQNLPVTREGDWGGVHINSGIPNHAFYLIAIRLGGYSWERAGKVWYETMLSADPRIKPRSTFKNFAEVTVEVAAKLFDNAVRDIVRQAWKDVGVLGQNSLL